jgi:hypothetical protein
MSETRFDDRAEAKTETLSGLELQGLKISMAGAQPIDESLIPADGISFYIVRLAKAIVVRTDGEFIIGREVDEDMWKPLVNLSALDGFARGVSRRHAMIRPVEYGYEVIDLFSTNGTWLDDQRLVPDKPYPLVPGAQLRVGQELLLVIYRSARVPARMTRSM